MTAEHATPEASPLTLTAAVLLLKAEAVVVGAIAIFLVFKDLTSTPSDVGVAVSLTVFTVLASAVIYAIARALGHHRGGARAPGIVVQLMLLAIGYYMIQGGLAWLGIAIIVLGVAVIALIVAPPSTRALGYGPADGG
ncbi:hypothetical protein [Catenuloplanes atrovinosus]|uniref:Integral membrane protein n=1 Tax=Catenuloplanes atrovinosus TaxID=137266 RepID=A0AAE3YZF7_9ACTN|nr:hypothetical protein [Catenuloplanes atrovinosus]MDR7280974.1 hypothetical protein [Catenuloplanes atrovinosus]